MPRRIKQPKTFNVLTMGDNVQIDALYAAGKSLTDLLRQLGISKSTVSRHMARIAETGSYVRKEGSGRKRKTTPQDDRLIVREVKRSRFASGKDIKASLPHLEVSEKTIRRRITESGEFGSYWSAKTPWINEKNRKSVLSGRRHTSIGPKNSGTKLCGPMSRLMCYGSTAGGGCGGPQTRSIPCLVQRLR